MSPPLPTSARAITPHRRGRHRPPPPAVDDRLVMPETRFEAIDGKVTYVAPADEPHGTHHSKIAALLEAHAGAAYQVAVDMLTRTSAKDDMAPDASVFPIARDPETGGRQLEELAFEVVSTERLSHAGKKARALTDRGVRRVFAVDVERRRALEWSRETGAWEILKTDGAIEDRALALPLPLGALTDAAKADDAVARALMAKKNPVFEQALRAAGNAGERRGKREGKREGRLEGKREAIAQILAARGIRVTKKDEKRLRGEADEATLDGWLGRAASCASAERLFGK
jgi:Uma2 family endonuclease